MSSVIDGKAVAERRLQALANRQLDLGLGIIVATDNPATATYVEQKRQAAKKVGFRVLIADLGPEATAENIRHAAEEFNRDPEIDGYIIQLPLPDDVDPDEALAVVDPHKDADGLSPQNLEQLYSGNPGVVPATPRGIMSLLASYDVPVSGKRVAVVGQGRLTGKPVAALLRAEGAKVTTATRATSDLAAVTSPADIVIVAAGRPGLITAPMVKEGAVVIDVGVTKLESETKGDVAFEEVSEKASLITPVPGGVGPMTVVSLLENIAELAEKRNQ